MILATAPLRSPIILLENASARGGSDNTGNPDACREFSLTVVSIGAVVAVSRLHREVLRELAGTDRDNNRHSPGLGFASDQDLLKRRG